MHVLSLSLLLMTVLTSSSTRHEFVLSVTVLQMIIFFFYLNELVASGFIMLFSLVLLRRNKQKNVSTPPQYLPWPCNGTKASFKAIYGNGLLGCSQALCIDFNSQ